MMKGNEKKRLRCAVMGIIIKFILRNIREKKFRTFLIIFSITLSAGLFFASSAISGTLEEMYVNRMRKHFGSAEILIHANEKSPSGYLSGASAEVFKEDFQYIIEAVEGGGFYKPSRDESVQVDLKGFDWKDLQQMNPVQLSHSFHPDGFKGKKTMISRVTAEKYKLDIGSTMEIEIGGQKHRFLIAATAEPIGPFQEDGRSTTVYMPKDTLSALQNNRGRATTVFIKLKDPTQLQQMMEALSKSYRRYTVREPVTREEIKQYTNRITTPFMLMTIMVLFMSVFIIYTSFKVITMERLPIIGTFRSIGATRKITDAVLLLESMVYGILGGLLGCGFGIGVLWIMTYLMSENPWTGVRMNVEIQFSPVQLVTSFCIALILSVISSLVPIIKISKIPVKDVVLNKVEIQHKKENRKLYIGVWFLATAILLPRFVPRQAALVFGGLCMLLSAVAVTLLIPYMIIGFVKVFERVYLHVFGNEGVLAAKNLRDNRNIINNITLLSIGISSLLMINTISHSVVKELVSFYREATFDVWMWTYQGDRNLDRLLKTVEGVSEVYGVIGAQNVEIADTTNQINLLHGVDKNRYADYWNVGLTNVQLQELDQDRNILLTHILKQKFGVNQGDILMLETQRGKKPYRVIGFFNSLRWTGNYALISERFLKSDMGEKYYDDIYIKTNKEPEIVKDSIKKKFERRQPWVMTIAQMEENEHKSNGQLFIILNGFSIMAMVIGIFGILNNFIISFIERKRFLAIFRSIGMSKGQMIKMIFIEALTGGLIGGIVGVFAGIAMISIIPYVMRAMDTPIPMHYSFTLFLYALWAGMSITVIASISPSLKSSKLNIVEAIKYE
ncbi:ABC transporter permease [Geosporobacter ferrireducens]|nr:FtsX-like permease family protein [Geosporobacter ferrireducens]